MVMVDADEARARRPPPDDPRLAYELEGHPWIALEPEDWPHAVVIVTDADGAFVARGLRPGRYNVTRDMRDGPVLVALPDGRREFGERIWVAFERDQPWWPASTHLVLVEGDNEIELRVAYASWEEPPEEPAS